MSVLLPLSDIPGFRLESGDRVVRIDGTRTAPLVVQGSSGRLISLYDHQDLSSRRELSFDLSLPSVRDRLGRALFAKLFPEEEQPVASPMSCLPWAVVIHGSPENHAFEFAEAGPEAPLLALADLCRQVFGKKP